MDGAVISFSFSRKGNTVTRERLPSCNLSGDKCWALQRKMLRLGLNVLSLASSGSSILSVLNSNPWDQWPLEPHQWGFWGAVSQTHSSSLTAFEPSSISIHVWLYPLDNRCWQAVLQIIIWKWNHFIPRKRCLLWGCSTAQKYLVPFAGTHTVCHMALKKPISCCLVAWAGNKKFFFFAVLQSCCKPWLSNSFNTH